MANRYLRASGNWNGPVWAATSGGAAGSASTPTSGDWVYIQNGHSVTLNADASCLRIVLNAGSLVLGGHRLSVRQSLWAGNNQNRTIDLRNGELHIWGALSGYNTPILIDEGALTTVLSDNSSIIVDCYDTSEDGDTYTSHYLSLGAHKYSDVNVNMGDLSDTPINVVIKGSPTFRSLIIQSKNSAAHTVNFEQDIIAKKFIALGSSSTNRLALECVSTAVNIDSEWDGTKYVGTCYGQNLAIGEVDFSYGEVGWGYVGTSSISTDANTGWTFQDPPKISTLVDPLTTAPGSNPNWTVSGVINQISTGKEGGGYEIAGGGRDRMVSTDTYDLVDSSVIFERPARGGTSDYTGFGVMALGDVLPWSSPKVGVTSEIYDNDEYANIYQYRQAGYDYQVATYPITTSRYIKAAISGQTLTVNHSDDGVTWSSGIYSTLSDEDLLMFRSVRLVADNKGVNLGNSQSIGSINPVLSASNDSNFLAFFYP